MIDLTEARKILSDLKANNTRDWYQAHKARIQEELLGPGHGASDELRQILEAECQARMTSKVYRMNRDLRFSNDKTPYNPYFRFSVWQAGSPQESSVCFHFSVEPGRLTMGVGRWEFGKKLEIFRIRCGELVSLLTPEMRLSEPELKRIPAGVQATPELEEHYRRKGLNVWIDSQHKEFAPSSFDTAKLRSFVPIYKWLETL